MKIVNVGINVRDLDGTMDFLEKYFDAKKLWEYGREGFKEYYIAIGDGPAIELMTSSDLTDIQKTKFNTGFIHICIEMDDREALDKVIEKVHEDGYEVFYEPATVGGNEIRAVLYEDLIFEVSCPET